MRLYHFTTPANVLMIAAEGLKASKMKETFWTGGVPVVYLTRQQSNLASAEDVAYLRTKGDEIIAEHDPVFGGSARLEVRLEPQKRLQRFRDYLVETGQEEWVRSLPRYASEQWFVYHGDIPRHRIDTRLPVPVMRECLEHHIATHPDPEARERFRAFLTGLVGMADDILVGFDLSEH